ncbi:Endoribonuclease Dicer homolog 4 [Linum grandiflorum]
MELGGEVNGKTDPLADTISCAVEDISSSCRNQDIGMAENQSGAEPEPYVPGVEKVVSEKQMLHEFCSVKQWKPPVYECCFEDGPSHRKTFICKVMVEVAVEKAESCTILECYSNPMPQKKAAAEHASSGAIWCLKKLGCLPIEPNAKSSKRSSDNKKLKLNGEYMS